ncbi:MAG: hypothetical protein H7833_09075 [Magnetococcus sp. DMHC-1]|nr:hypothetical protein [Magnetococcales bacterium]
MCKVHTIFFLVFLSFFVGNPDQASAGIGQRQSSELKFDGVWIGGDTNVTLIKELNGYIIFQGKDHISTWSAKGVINGDKITCRGTGITNEGHEFVYESMITYNNGILNDSWKAFFAGGKILEGNDKLIRGNLSTPPARER